jgi:hypothetical protein
MYICCGFVFHGSYSEHPLSDILTRVVKVVSSHNSDDALHDRCLGLPCPVNEPFEDTSAPEDVMIDRSSGI